MKITYEKQYREQNFKNFTLYGNGYGGTYVFTEYYDLITSYANATCEELTSVIEYYKPTAKSKLRISYDEKGIEFFKPNKYVFPEFYIIFKD